MAGIKSWLLSMSIMVKDLQKTGTENFRRSFLYSTYILGPVIDQVFSLKSNTHALAAFF